MRFTESHTSYWGSNYFWWLWHMEWTQNGKQCATRCNIDPDDEGRDICQYRQGNDMITAECVKLASTFMVRQHLSQQRNDALKTFQDTINEINANLSLFSPVIVRQNNLMLARAEQNKKVAEIQNQKSFLKIIIQTLNGYGNALDQWKDSVAKLKAILQEMAANYEFPEGNCNGMPFYEKELEGDGLKAMQYNNLRFQGDAKKRIDPRIKFFWSGEPPINDVNPNNFTVVWKGFLRPPKTGDQTFTCDSDNGCLVLLNNSVIIRDNIPDGPIEDLLDMKLKQMDKKIAQGEWDEFIKPPGLKDPDRWPRFIKTETPVPLVGGDYVSIEVRMLHSVQSELFEDGNSQIFLQWESDEIRKQIIPSNQFFTRIKQSAMKPTDQDNLIFMVDTLQENDAAFVDDESYKIKQIPSEFKGLFVLKTKAEYTNKTVKFNLTLPVRVQVAFDSGMNPPVDSSWKESPYIMSFLKVNSTDLPKLEMGQTVIASDDVILSIYQKDFGAGTIEFETNVGKPIRLIIFLAPGSAPPEMTCGGAEIELSSDTRQFEKCQESTKEKENDCNKGLTMGDWKASGSVEEQVVVKFKSTVKPTKVVVKQPKILENHSRKIKFQMSNSNFETLNCIQDEDPQKFKLTKPIPTETVKIAIESTQGGKNAGGNFKVFGVPCEEPGAREKEAKAKQKAKMGIKEKLKAQSKSCEDSLDSMTVNEMKVTCLEDCAIDESFIYEAEEGKYTMDSPVCQAAKKFYTGKEEFTNKDFGVVRMKNDKKVNGSVPPQVQTFNAALLKDTVKQQIGDEVDVLDEVDCQVRASVLSHDGSVVTITYKGQNKTYPQTNVQQCGNKLPFIPCKKPITNAIKIKFVPGSALIEFKKKNVGEFLQDTGALAKQNGVFQYGWTQPPKVQAIDGINSETDKKKLTQGTAAEMVEGTEWFIQLPNGKQDVKVHLKLVDNKINQAKQKGKMRMDFMMNDTEVKTEPMGLPDEMIHDKPNFSVTKQELRLKWKEGVVSLVLVELVPMPGDADNGAVKTEVEPNNFIGGDCMKNSKNCMFSESIMDQVNCDGVMVKIGAKAKNRKMACLQKCVDREFKSMDECNKQVPDTLKCMKKGKQFVIS